MWRTFHKNVCVVLLTCAISVHLLAAPYADRIIIHKKARTLELMHTGQVLKTYKIALGGEPVGPKTRQGDHHTPEGVYVIKRIRIRRRGASRPRLDRWVRCGY